MMTVKEGDTIFLGQVTNDSSSSPSTPTSVALEEMQDAAEELNGRPPTNGGANSPTSRQQPTSSTSSAGSSFISPSPSGTYAGVNLDALNGALSTVESNGNYGAVGSIVCDLHGNCGRALGSFQFMSYRPDVRTSIESQPGGVEFLQSLDSGATPTSEQVTQYFPSSEQERLFQEDSIR